MVEALPELLLVISSGNELTAMSGPPSDGHYGTNHYSTDKLDEERRGAGSRLSSVSVASRNSVDERNVRLQQALLRRQALLDQLKREKYLKVDYHRSYSHVGKHRTPSPVTPPPARRSVPPDMSHPRHVVEYRPVHLDPLPAAQTHVITTPPQPYVIHSGAPQQTQSNIKADFMEMMMMQNAQMHQMVMQQMMLSAIPKNNSLPPISPRSVTPSRRPPSVHHHHYSPPPPQPALFPPPPQPQAYQLPPAGYQPYPQMLPPLHMPYGYGPSLHHREAEPLKQPRTPRKVVKRRIPYPGPHLLRKFRHAAYAVWATKILENFIYGNGKQRMSQLARQNPDDPDFIFSISLKEIVNALHKRYLNPYDRIYTALTSPTMPRSSDYTVAVEMRQTEERQKALQEIAGVMESIVFSITDIMPSTGVLGTHRKAAVYDLIMNGQHFPRGYLWDIERRVLPFDHRGRTVNLTSRDAFLLLTGITIGRALVSTLLLKPVEYNLVETRLTQGAEQNLRVIATIFIYILRRLWGQSNKPLDIPQELYTRLYTDESMKSLYSKLKKNIESAESDIKRWGEEYVRRLQNS